MKWLHRLRATANDNVSREQHSQLGAVLDYFNRESKGTSDQAAVEWDDYRKDIHTPGVVDKIQGKYDDFMNAEYHVDGAVQKCGVRSADMKALDVAMHYNYHLWMVHYIMHLDQIETLYNIGDVTKIGKMEMAEFFPGATRYNSQQQEVGSIAPQDLFENPVTVRIATQFSWGSRYCPPFVHSNDSVSSVVSTLSKLGK